MEGYQESNELSDRPKDRRKSKLRKIAGVSDQTPVREKRKRPRQWWWDMDWKAKGMSGCVCRSKTFG